MKVNEIMHANVITCAPETSLDSVARSMWENDCGAVAVVDAKGAPVGIVTDRDIAMGAAIQGKPLWEMCSHDITRDRPLHVCSADASVPAALELMESHEVRRLPVVGKDGRLAGMLSIGDVVNHTAGDSRRHRGEVDEDRTLRALKAVMPHGDEARSGRPRLNA